MLVLRAQGHGVEHIVRLTPTDTSPEGRDVMCTAA